ncbi:hypothetical protein T484DRAFT_1803638, partial [Baffinella frigidus]
MLLEKDEAMSRLEGQCAAKDGEIAGQIVALRVMGEELAGKNHVIAGKDAELAAKEGDIAGQRRVIRERAATSRAELDGKDSEIARLRLAAGGHASAELDGRDDEIARLRRAAGEHALGGDLAAKDRVIAAKDRVIAARDEEMEEQRRVLQEALAARDEE